MAADERRLTPISILFSSALIGVHQRRIDFFSLSELSEGLLKAPPCPVRALAECGHERAASGGVERVLGHADFGNLDGEILGPQRRGKTLQKPLWNRRPTAQNDGHRL